MRIAVAAADRGEAKTNPSGEASPPPKDRETPGSRRRDTAEPARLARPTP